MELWQMDLVGGFTLADGTHCKALTGIDDHSRYCVSAHLMTRERTRAVCEGLAAAMRVHGAQQILTDNGKVFTGRFNHPPTEVLCDRICRENGVDHLLTAPRSPTTTGKIERFHRSLRAEFLTGRVFGSLAAAQDELDRWVAFYNTHRPHQAIGMVAPADRFTARPGPAALDQVPAPRRALDDSALRPDRTRDGWVSRKVTSCGTISVCGQQFSVGKHRVGRAVDVHVTDQLLQAWDGPDLIKTVVRTSEGEVRKKHAAGGRRG